MRPVPLSSLRLSKHFVPAHGRLPNSVPTGKPLLVYHGALGPSPTPDAVESLLRSVGVVQPQWRYTMYRTTHFHSTTHEVLCVVGHGSARLCFGGEENPGRVVVEAAPGDVLVVPAGVAHRLLDETGGDSGDGGDGEGFEMVGSYPAGAAQWDMCYGKAGEEAKVEGIARLPWFTRDPVYGDHGPVLDV